MNLKFLLFALSTVVFYSCSSTYKNGQTPDDVYYSPVKTIKEEVQQEERSDGPYANSTENRQIRMARYDRRWNNFDDDYNCHYDPYRYGYNYGYYYNPYYCAYPVYNPSIRFVNPKNTTPRMTNLGSYYNTRIQTTNPKTGVTQWVNTGWKYNNSNNSSTRRQVLTPSNSNNNSNNPSDNSTRTYTPSSSNSSSGGGTKSSGTPVTRPGRGG